MNPALADRRRELRRPARGAVRLMVEEPVPHEVHGELLDLSDSGLGAVHTDSARHAGQEV